MTNLKRILVSLVLASGMAGGGSAFAQVAVNFGDTFTSGFQTSIDTNAVFTNGSVSGYQNNTFASLPPGQWNGSVFSNVFTTSLNPYGGDSVLSFIYRFSDFGGTNSIERVTLADFTGFQTTVYTTDFFGGVAPTKLNETSAGVLGFDVALSAGTLSEYMVVYTDATAYGQGWASIIDGGIAQPGVFAPIPEPETYALMLAGLGLMGFIARRRRQNTAG